MQFSRGSNSTKVILELRKIFSQQAKHYDNRALRETVSALTTGQEIKFKLPKKRMEFLKLCCLHWYITDEVLRFLLHDELYLRREQFGPDYEQQISLLLESEAKMLIFLVEGHPLGRTPEELFGNILSNIPEFQYYIQKPREPKKTQRHRGYRDKGSLRSNCEYLDEERKDFTTTEEQNLIEETRESRRDSLQFWSGFLD